jgi:uncharacterized membrane protein SpoIIM required for sporulation
MVVGAFLGNAEVVPNLNPYSVGVLNGTVAASPVLFVNISLANLFVSGFLLLTLSGFVFFILSPVVLSLRALLWGVLLNGLSTQLLLLTLPVFVLEGESYVLMSLSGVSLGLSWVRPRWLYGEGSVGRVEALRRALKESLQVYVLVVVLLLVGAALETLVILAVS